MSITVGIDIGGTFTDVVAYDHSRQQLHYTKVPSTPPFLSEGFLAGITKILLSCGQDTTAVTRLIHGTTVSLNACLEQKGAVLGILSTEGFEDVLTIGRQKRTAMYDLFMDPETPTFLCPRRRIIGIPERLAGDGSVAIPLDENAVRDAARVLVEKHGIDCLVIFYLHSFQNAEHERRSAEIVREMYPDLKITLSSTVDPRFREYERLCVAAFDAYVKPVTETYIDELEQRLSEQALNCRLQIMQSRGGITNARTTLEKPVTTIMSGPAAAVVAGRHLGELINRPNLVTVDIGGTSCDIALISGNKPLISMEGAVRYYPLRLPMIDVNSIGAGGGSIAWIDSAGGLKIGPQSAGSRPGPVCYGKGGVEPTVTDASLVLGYLNPENFACGEIGLDRDLALKAVEGLANRLGLSLEEAALGIHRIINSNMADEMRLASIKRGYDPRAFSIVAAGGGGALHAGRLGQLLHMREVIVPNAPGCLSAFGLLVADIEHEHGTTHQVDSESVDHARMTEVFIQLEEICAAKMVEDDVDQFRVQTVRFAGMRYVGQSYDLEVELQDGPLDDAWVTAARQSFHELHERIYGHFMADNPVEFVNLRVTQRFPLENPRILPGLRTGSVETALTSRRAALFDLENGYIEVAVYDRSLLPVGSEILGPAIIEQADTTTVVYPGHRLKVDEYGNMVITLPQAASQANGLAAVVAR